ncbi:MAG: TonB-dependent receptor [Pseudomonadota bacterium]
MEGQGATLSLSLAVAAALYGGALMAPVAMAQDESANSAQDDPMMEEVLVTGTRGRLMRAQSLKQDSTTIVEALTVDDIGQLPDTSIAESLARLTGLAGERRNGRTSGISVRGFREDFVGTTLNGRELLGIGDNRGVEFDLYPSEILSGALIYKSMESSLYVQGIGGVVDLRTTKPLESASYLTTNLSYEQNGQSSANPDFDDNGYRLALGFSDRFADDTVGLAFAVTHTESPSQEEHFRGWGYPTVDPANAADGVTLTGDETVVGGHDSFARSASLERTAATAVLQFEPSEKVTATLDALYIDFQEDEVFRGVEEGGAVWGTGDYTVTSAENGFVTGGVIDGGFLSVIRNDAERTRGELTTFGANLEFRPTENWVLGVDASYGETQKRITNIESYSGVGRAGLDTQGDPTVRSFQSGPDGTVYSGENQDLTDFDMIRLAGPQSWGGALAPVDAFAPNDAFPNIGPSQAQDGFVNEPIFDEDLTAIAFNGQRYFEGAFLDRLGFGFRYSDRSKSKDNDGFFLTAPTFPEDALIPEEVRAGATDLSFIGIPGVVAYDALALFDSGFYTATDASALETGRLGDTYTVNEELLQFYTQLDFRHDFAAFGVSGNAGVQVVNTDQQATGFSTQTGPDLFVQATPVEGGDDYTDILPSFNLNFDFNNGHKVRLAASKTLSRPRMDDMRPNTTVSFNFNAANVAATDPAAGPWGGNAGNPALRPLEANNVDLAYEWYFADDGFLSVGFFYKDLVNWHREGAFIADFSSFFIPGYHQATADNGDIITPGTFDGVVTFREDGLEGDVRGYEFQANVPFHLFHEALDGFGVSLGVAIMSGGLEDGGRVPGLSDENYQLTAFYERAGFEIRVSGRRRTDFLTEARGLSLALTPLTDQGAELWDAQIAYDFGAGGFDRLSGLRVALQGQNLTNEVTTLTNEDSREVLQFQTFGATYLLRVNYQFR